MRSATASACDTEVAVIVSAPMDHTKSVALAQRRQKEAMDGKAPVFVRDLAAGMRSSASTAKL
jgi:hypothetical protein